MERSSRSIRSSALSIALERRIHNETFDPLERSFHLIALILRCIARSTRFIALSIRSIALSTCSIALRTRFIALTLRFTHARFEPVELSLAQTDIGTCRPGAGTWVTVGTKCEACDACVRSVYA